MRRVDPEPDRGRPRRAPPAGPLRARHDDRRRRATRTPAWRSTPPSRRRPSKSPRPPVARAESRFVCQTCGAAFLRWEGQCRSCEAWNTLVETVVRVPSRAERAATAARAARAGVRPSRAVALSVGRGRRRRPDAAGHRRARPRPRRRPRAGLARARRRRAGRRQVDAPAPGRRRASPPAAASRARSSTRPARRPPPRSACGPAGSAWPPGVPGTAIAVLAESEVGRIVEVARATRPALVVVDSIQTMTVDELDGPAGSVGQVRESALRLMELAKGEGIAVVLVGHVTKDGSIAGPKTLEHLVDAVLDLGGERSGDAAPPAGDRRTASARPRRSASSSSARTGCARSRIPAGPSSSTTTARRRAASSRRRWRAAGRCSSRSRRSSPRPATARRPGARPASIRTGSR